ncbi:MAG: NAD-glutamate dehydrogenase domain-containing protein, partial [Mariprofundaceae bacterium]
MRQLRSQLIGLLEEAQKQQRQGFLPTRLGAALVHNFLSLLTDRKAKRYGLRWRLISQQQLHRHIICIRCPDQAFYLDGIKNYFSRRGIQTLEQQTMVVRIACDDTGCTLSVRPPDERHQHNNMFIALHISATLVPDGKSLSRELGYILQAVDMSVRDFPAMNSSIEHATELLKKDDQHAAELLTWMNNDKYLYFGLRLQNQRYGLMRDGRVLNRVAAGLTEEINALPPPAGPGLEWLYLGSAQNYLYSPASLEVVRICWRSDGRLSHAILLGHFSRSARYTNASRIPYIKQIWQNLQSEPLLQQSAFYRREIRTVFDRMAKPILLTIPVKRFLSPLKDIIDAASPTETRTAVWQPHPGNVCILMATVPSARFGPNILANILNGIKKLGLEPLGQESFIVGPQRLLFIPLQCNIDERLEKKLGDLVQQSIIFWKDRAKAIILKNAKGINVPDVLAEIEKLPPLYHDLFLPDQIQDDLATRDLVRADKRTRVRVHRSNSGLDLYIFSSQELALGRLVSAIQAFGMTALQEAVVTFPGEPIVHLSSLRCEIDQAIIETSIISVGEGLEQVLNGEADNDDANALILSAGLNIKETGIIITLRNYLIQLLADAAPTPLTRMLNRYPKTSAMLIRLFEAQHRPSMPLAFAPQARIDFDQSMNEVQSLTDDRWFRALQEIVTASVRSNAYIRQTGEPFSIKTNLENLSFVPKPIPYREIFLHGTHVEGIHMRAGPVARGGIRYSDRPADFRTEIRELMATQIVKNGQIIPTGAKGGFVVRGGKGEAFVQEQYRIFIRALLQLSDSLLKGRTLPPHDIKIPVQDRQDTYLVVAADKGTARYSDMANDEAIQTGFWLGDAFASGGKHGYDHKEIGITARGAWVCVREHFAALGMNADEDPISVVGIGDMGGDVFGNGMLQSKNLCLVGAFNHQHIFLDPNPDPEISFKERQKMFRSGNGWGHYNPDTISPGGGIFLRTAKQIPLSPEAQVVLGVDEKEFSGEALIRTLLAAPVDLLYNGGIGTYIRASDETNIEVRDPANNSVRITARELRCRVLAEGGNLGLTQKARIEFTEMHGHMNTDAIDNSAGVDMSDHEVNLKILFAFQGSGQIPLGRRNRLLKSLTEEVTNTCLENSLAQSRALNLAEIEARSFPPRIQRLRDHLVDEGRIDPQTDPGMEQDDTL